MAIREYLCNYCGHQWDDVVFSTDPEDYRFTTCRCGSKAEVLPALIGGYNGNTGSSSTRPRNSTAMQSKKAFTRHPGNQGEPEVEQLELELVEKKPEQA